MTDSGAGGARLTIAGAVEEAEQAAAPPRVQLLTAVFVGGCAGTAARSGLAELLPHAADAWPWATMLANLAGCLLLGWATAGLLLGPNLDPRVRPLLATGLCGALTTFSTFQVELLRMLDTGAAGLAVAYAAVSLTLGVLAVLLGRTLARRTHPPLPRAAGSAT